MMKMKVFLCESVNELVNLVEKNLMLRMMIHVMQIFEAEQEANDLMMVKVVKVVVFEGMERMKHLNHPGYVSH